VTVADTWGVERDPDDEYVGRHHLSDNWQWRNPGQPFRINQVGPQERPSREPSLIGSTLTGGAFKS
jgi:hypothetical protein